MSAPKMSVTQRYQALENRIKDPKSLINYEALLGGSRWTGISILVFILLFGTLIMKILHVGMFISNAVTMFAKIGS